MAKPIRRYGQDAGETLSKNRLYRTRNQFLRSLFWDALLRLIRGYHTMNCMDKSNNSSLPKREEKTVSGEEGQSSRAGSWRALAFIILCTVTTILGKRTPYPSVCSIEAQGKNLKEEEDETENLGKVRDALSRNPQRWGNVALLLIQVALFALFQLVEHYDGERGGHLAIGTFVALLAVGLALYAATTKVEFALVVIFFMGLVFTVGVLTSAISESGKEGLGWIAILTGFQAANLFIAWCASEGIKRTSESNSEAFENVQLEAPLTRRVRNYSQINLIVSFLGASIALVPILEISRSSDMGSAELYGNGIMAFLSLVGSAMFLDRFFWMHRARKHGYQVTDSPDDYSLERTTFFAWLLFVIVLAVQYFSHKSIGDFGLGTVGGWIIALAFWTPIVSIVGSSWGKLKATAPNGDKAVWPSRWSKVKKVKG